MKNVIITSFILLFNIAFGQTAADDIKTLDGIWIAKEYYDSFENTKSAVKSKNAFEHNYPVALRINSKEIKNGVLNIGYAELHDHIIHPEVSDFVVKDNDIIRERSFKVDLTAKDSVGFYKTTNIYYFNYNWISYLTWNTKDTSLKLYRPKGNEHEEKFIEYVRVTNEFKNDYLFPNPLYYYTRQKTIIGNYTLKDSNGNILSNNFKIFENGLATGYKKFDNFTFYFSTDIYCGPPTKFDKIVIIEDILNDDSESFVFLIEVENNNTINLYDYQINNLKESYEITQNLYKLVRN